MFLSKGFNVDKRFKFLQQLAGPGLDRSPRLNPVWEKKLYSRFLRCFTNVEASSVCCTYYLTFIGISKVIRDRRFTFKGDANTFYQNQFGFEIKTYW